MSLVDEDKANNKWIIRCDHCGNVFSSVVVHDKVPCPKCHKSHKILKGDYMNYGNCGGTRHYYGSIDRGD
jgi:Zn finger protein HypA/HybF involved in hydrogenase expression